MKILGVLLLIIGWPIAIIGIILVYGNLTNALPSFSFAGFITTTIGSLIIISGRKSMKRKSE
jgi:hypothetical protein